MKGVILSKLKDVDDQYTVLDALDAVDEYVEKKPGAINVAIIKSAIKEGWVAKNKKSRLDIRMKLDQEGRYDEQMNLEDLSNINLLNYKKDIEQENRLLEFKNHPINKKIHQILKENFDKEIYDRWLNSDKLQLLNIIEQGGQIEEIEFSVEDKMRRDWIIREYKDSIFNLLKSSNNFSKIHDVVISSIK
jgi:hypothetical protein